MLFSDLNRNDTIASFGDVTVFSSAPTTYHKGITPFTVAAGTSLSVGGVTVPAYSKGILVASGANGDCILFAEDYSGRSYTSYRSNGSWSSNGRILATEPEFGNINGWLYWKFSNGLFACYKTHNFSSSITGSTGGLITETVTLPITTQGGGNYGVFATLHGYILANGSATLLTTTASYNQFDLRLIATVPIANPVAKLLVIGKWN